VRTVVGKRAEADARLGGRRGGGFGPPIRLGGRPVFVPFAARAAVEAWAARPLRYDAAMDDASLGKFIAAVEQVRREGAGRVDAATRQEIARELGWSAEDLEAARQRGEADLVRGEGFLRHRAWADARRSLLQAELLLPDELRVLHALARAYDGMRDEEGVRRTTDRCLELDPQHEPSFALRARMQARPSKVRQLIIAGSALAVLGVVGVGATVAVRSLQARWAGAPNLCGEERSCEVAVAVASVPGVLVDRPILRVSPRALRLELGAKVTQPAEEGSELEQLVVELRLLDEQGRKLESREVTAQPDFAPPLRPGDTAPFYYSAKVPAATRSAQLVVLRKRAIPAPATYDVATPAPLTFDPPAPAHFKLRGGFRSYQKRQLDAMTSFEAVLEVENEGSGVIRSLDLEWRAVDAEGVLLGRADRQTMAYAHMPPMAPQERRLVRIRLWVPSRVASEVVVVTGVQ
jgi:hypothetical protein